MKTRNGEVDLCDQKTSVVIKQILRDLTSYDMKEIKEEFKRRKLEDNKQGQLEVITEHLKNWLGVSLG